MVVRGYRSQVRARQAEDTRRLIVEAAATLFAERGYARTSVAAVAAAAGVAVNTVYTSVGGKSALIMAMSEDGAADAVAVETERRIGECTDPREILRIVADGTGQVRRRRQQTLTILLDNRTADPDVASAACVKGSPANRLSRRCGSTSASRRGGPSASSAGAGRTQPTGSRNSPRTPCCHQRSEISLGRGGRRLRA